MPLGRLKLLIYLAKSELQRRHAGSVVGVAWTVIGPMALIGAMWFALDVGLGLRATLGTGFGAGLVVGMVAWLAFATSISDATSSILRNPHLVKKMVFPIELMPLATVMATFAVHLAMLAILVLLLAWSGHLVLGSIWALPLAMVLSLVLTSGIAFAVAALNTVVRDTQAVAPFLTTVWFWLTPVIWSPARLPADWHWLIALNPMAIVVEGYKTALLGTTFPFSAATTFTSACVAILVCTLGILLFTVLRPIFADAL